MDTEQICLWVRSHSRKDLKNLAGLIGLPYPTLEAIKVGRTNDPRGKTCDKIRSYINHEEEA